MMTSATTANAKKDKKKAKRFALWFHAILLVGFTFPFLSNSISEAPKYEQVVTIEFSDFKSAAARSSTQKPAPTPPKVADTNPIEKVTPQPPKVAPRKPVIKTPKTKVPVLKEAPTVAETTVETKKTPNTPPAPPSPTSTEQGEGTKGTSDKGDAETDGKADKGDSGLDFSGDGLFTRRVIHRAEIKQLTKEEGRIVINLCVNRAGRVVYTDYNKEKSTIGTPSLIRQAMQATLEYRFEKDYTAPNKQCGTLTYLFEIEAE